LILVGNLYTGILAGAGVPIGIFVADWLGWLLYRRYLIGEDFSLTVALRNIY